jgi:hypothetical protein
MPADTEPTFGYGLLQPRLVSGQRAAISAALPRSPVLVPCSLLCDREPANALRERHERCRVVLRPYATTHKFPRSIATAFERKRTQRLSAAQAFSSAMRSMMSENR